VVCWVLRWLWQFHWLITMKTQQWNCQQSPQNSTYYLFGSKIIISMANHMISDWPLARFPTLLIIKYKLQGLHLVFQFPCSSFCFIIQQLHVKIRLKYIWIMFSHDFFIGKICLKYQFCHKWANFAMTTNGPLLDFNAWERVGYGQFCLVCGHRIGLAPWWLIRQNQP